METDRELTELAAKAGRVNIDPDRYDDAWGFAIRGTSQWWNPCYDDGDSRRLEVDLLLTVAVRYHDVEVFDEHGECLSSVEIIRARRDFPEPLEVTDPHAATRLAVFCAAVEIGRAMP